VVAAEGFGREDGVMAAGVELEWFKVSWAVIAAVATGGAAVATGLWAGVTWLVQRLEDRRAQRRRQAALYVHRFLFAAEDLQARLYDILKARRGERRTDASSPHPFAEDTAYLIAQYLGWERFIIRRGRYAGNRRTVRLIRAIRDAFATDTLVPQMRLSRPEQDAIAALMLKRVQGQFGTEFEAIPFFEFVAAIQSAKVPDRSAAQPRTLGHVASLRKAVETLRAVTSSETVPGAQRLARVQNRLVALLGYLEKKERISLSDGRRCLAPEAKQIQLA
jgi:hypothetical protein